jgi:hypothetical protein
MVNISYEEASLKVGFSVSAIITDEFVLGASTTDIVTGTRVDRTHPNVPTFSIINLH